MAELTPYQRDILARTALGEAGGRGPDAMADVIQVVLNRTRSPKFPDDPAEVALQNKQFSTWNKGSGGNNPQRFSPNSKAYQTAAQVVDLVASGKAPDMTGGALDYHASNVSPYWAGSKKGQYGTIERNGHTFYPTHPVPPGDLPSVASLLSVYREAPTPVTSSPDLDMMRRTTMPSRLVADTFAKLPQRPGSKLADSLALKPIQGGRQTAQPFDAAFDTRTGAMRMLAEPEAVSSQGLGVGTSREPVSLPQRRPKTAPADIIETSFRRVASANPTRLPDIAPSTLDRAAAPQQSQIERGAPRTAAVTPLPQKARVTVSTPYTTPQSGIERGAPRAVAQSPVGQPPATRVVQSVAMPPLKPASTAAALVAAADQAQAAKTEERLPSTPMAGSRAAPPTVVYDPSFSTAEVTGNVAQTTRPTGPLAPIPRQTIARVPAPVAPYNAVATDLDVRPMPELPRRRPDLGMGGVDIDVAPTPLPRLQRGGIFGRPKILGHDVPLPGILGVLQGATMAMNNASGPFNNGADNALYNGLRGGDFNTPLAATHQSGGYLFAAKPGGGFVNVGRVNPGQSAADLYDQRNSKNGGPRTAADRPGKSLSQMSGDPGHSF